MFLDTCIRVKIIKYFYQKMCMNIIDYLFIGQAYYGGFTPFQLVNDNIKFIMCHKNNTIK